jgi:fermentation-respiration switch protein FrsA (DUF1100 family)
MFYLLSAVPALYIGLVAFMAIFQRQFLYFPDKQLGTPDQYGLTNFTEVFFKTSDGVSLQSWYKQAENNMPTILYFHGNASHMGNRAGIYSALAGKGFGVLAISYRGYGKSEGKPSEQGLYIDGRTAISFLTEAKNIPLQNIIIYGESLGTGVSVQMATEFKVGAMVLQAPYTSVTGRAAEIYFFIPVRLVLLDNFDSIDKISKVQSPLLIIHGELDETIPIRHGKMMLAAANSPKEAIFFHDVGHNNFDSTAIAVNVLEFAKKNGLIAK